MATAYGETFLGLKSRRTDQMGHYICGPFIYMEDLLGTKWLGRIYGVLCILCSLGMGSMVQANSAVNSVAYSWNVQKGTAGVLLTGAVLLVVAGGIGRIGRAAEMLVPAASGIYILFSAIVIFSCFRQLPGAVREIFTCGFTPRAAAGEQQGTVLARRSDTEWRGEYFPTRQASGLWQFFTVPLRIPLHASRECGLCLRCFSIRWFYVP